MTKKKKEMDYKAMALFEMAHLHYKKAEEFANELEEHLKTRFPNVENWLWDNIIDGNFEKFMKDLKNEKV